MNQQRPRAFVRDAADLLRVDGADALDLFHRIAASDVRAIESGSFATVVFTDEKGRTIDAPVVHRRDDHLALICGPTRGTATRAWIERWVITEDVTVSTLDETVIEVLADDAHEASSFVVQAAAIPDGFDVLDLEAWRAHFVRAGVVVAGPAVETGPNPLEIGWRDRVSWTKGCYIGQEVVARLDTYDKVKRDVARLRTNPEVSAGATLRIGAKKVGVVLDAVGSDALAVVDRSVDPSTELEVQDGDGSGRASIT